MRIKRKMMVLVILFCLVISTMSVLAKGPDYVLKFASTGSAQKGYFVYDQFVSFKSEVESRSGGRIEVVYYPGGALGSTREIVEGIIAGTIEIAPVSPSIVAAFLPELMVLEAPYLFSSLPQAWKVFDGPVGKQLSNMLREKVGLRMVGGINTFGFRHFTNNVRPIHEAKDMVGLKIRVMEAPLYIKLVQALGASPEPISMNEVYMSLQTGVIDGQEQPVANNLAYNLNEVQKYMTLDAHTIAAHIMLMNDKFLNNLPDDLEEIILKSARIAVLSSRGSTTMNEAYATIELSDKMDIYTPTEEEMKGFVQARQPAIEWLKGQVDPDFVEFVLSEAKKAEMDYDW